MIRSQHKGFTLIELLVVIAIIGILSAVVLASLNTARSKGNDAAIQSDLSSIQSEAEIYYGTTGNNSYAAQDSTANCTLNGSMFDPNSAHASYDGTIARAIAAAKSASGSGAVNCLVGAYPGASGNSYAVSAALVNGITVGGVLNMFWCVDSTGAAKPENAALASGGLTNGGATAVCP